MMKKINYFEVASSLKKVATASALMAIATFALFATGTNLIVNICASCILYFLALYFLREPLFEEFKNIFSPPQSAAAQPS